MGGPGVSTPLAGARRFTVLMDCTVPARRPKVLTPATNRTVPGRQSDHRRHAAGQGAAPGTCNVVADEVASNLIY